MTLLRNYLFGGCRPFDDLTEDERVEVAEELLWHIAETGSRDKFHRGVEAYGKFSGNELEVYQHQIRQIQLEGLEELRQIILEDY